MQAALKSMAARVNPGMELPIDPLDGNAVESFIGRLLDAATAARETQVQELLLPRIGDLERAAAEGDREAVLRHAARLRLLLVAGG